MASETMPQNSWPLIIVNIFGNRPVTSAPGGMSILCHGGFVEVSATHRKVWHCIQCLRPGRTRRNRKQQRSIQLEQQDPRSGPRWRSRGPIDSNMPLQTCLGRPPLHRCQRRRSMSCWRR